MLISNVHLFEHELFALLEALRRDLRLETQKIASDPELADLHSVNARMALRLLETLRPRHSRRHIGIEQGKQACSALVPAVSR
jgi:hypothetical protein